jgi:hypothetical protein
VLAQEAQIIFGHSVFGNAMFILVQAATALILYTGANTSFNGFPFLASYVAGDAFLPRWLLKRGHRLVFSNGIIVLTARAPALPTGRRQRRPAGAVLRDRGVHAFAMAGFAWRNTTARTGVTAGAALRSTSPPGCSPRSWSWSSRS